MGVYLESLTIELALILTTLFTGLLLYAKFHVYAFFDRLKVPAFEGSAPFGSIWSVFTFKQPFGEAVNDFYQVGKNRWKGAKMFGYYQCLTPVIMLVDPELINRVLIKDFSHFQDHGFPIDTEVNPMDCHLFNLGGSKWRTLRHKLSPTFTSGKLKWMFVTMNDVANHLTEFVQCRLNEEINVGDLFCGFTTDVIGTCAFGIDPNAINDPNCNFRQMGQKIFHPKGMDLFRGIFRVLFPEIALKLKMITIPRDICDFFFSLTAQAFEHRIKTGEKRRDFVELLLQLKQKGEIDIDSRDVTEDDDYIMKSQVKVESGDEEKLVFTDNLLAAQASVFFVAGFETSATTMTFTTYQLASYPEIQKKAREEVQAAKAKYGDITYEALKDMHYLESCILETLRLFPPFSIGIRKSTKPYRFPDGVSIPEGISIAIPIKGLHHDSNYYPDPEEYRPQRFMPGEPRVPGTFLPFGDGPRVCIAQRFAMLELKLGLAKILDQYEITKSPKTQEPLVMDPKSFIPTPIGGIWARFKKID